MPFVVEQTTPPASVRMTSSTRLLKDRIVFLGTPVDDDVANVVIGADAVPRERRSGQGDQPLPSTVRAAR